MTTPDDLRLRLDFLGFGSQDHAALASIAPLLERHAGEFVEAFYRHLLSFEGTRALLADPAVKSRLVKLQHEYLLSLAPPELDAEYVARRVRIGETHERIRLEPRWYLGAYSLYLELLIPVVFAEHASDRAHAERVLQALIKVLMLDAQLAMEAYIGRRERELEYLTQELAASSRDLERSYAEQGAELRQTSERARAAEQLASIGTLVAGLAHEIGTPMGVIQGHAEMLESSVGDERGRWRLRTIREQIERISGIIETLLHMARPRRDEPAQVDLGELVAGCLEFVAEKLAGRGIEVERHFERRATLVAEGQKLQQVFLNLFLNAADAMPDGGTLRVMLEDAGAERVRIRVADTGDGIDADALERVFEPFFTTKPAGQGNGLGLMVARGIVEEHGGQIEVRSEPGHGTEFQIELPATITSIAE